MSPIEDRVPADRLLSIIELQNEIVAAGLDLDGVVSAVAARARALIGGEVVVEGLTSLRAAGLSPDGVDAATLALLSEVIAAHVARRRDDRPVDFDGRHDRLTGLRNRRAFDERIESELARARRQGGQFALCFLDLSAMWEVNQRDGCAAGDAVLRAVAGHLSGVRGEDAAYRLGGDEFALVLVEASRYGAEAAIDRVTAAIAEDPACRSIRLACGVATFQRGDDAASVLARADASLYRAKATACAR